MMYPILCKVRYESLYEILSQRGIWKQIFFSIFVNWVLAPFLMVHHMPIHFLIVAPPTTEHIADGILGLAGSSMGVSSRQARIARRPYPRRPRKMYCNGSSSTISPFFDQTQKMLTTGHDP